MGLKELFVTKKVKLALLPEKNDYLLTEEGKRQRQRMGKEQVEELHKMIETEPFRYVNLTLLDKLGGYTVPLIAHDYGALTPKMWNTVYEKQGINIRNIMVIANPNDGKEIFDHLKEDTKYLGGGAGVGFKESSLQHLNMTIPPALKSVNILVNNGRNLIGYNTDAAGFVKSLEEKFAEIEKKIEGSTIIIFGAGGVAKEVADMIAQKKPKRIRVINRTFGKAVAIADELNKRYGDIATGLGEEMIRGSILNSEFIPDAIVNLTDKGSDGPLENVSAFAEAGEKNIELSRERLRYLYQLNPKVIIADIVLPKSGESISLRLAKAEGIKNLIDGKPMVIYQAVPAYLHIQKAHPKLHDTILNENIILSIMKDAANRR